MSLDCKLIEQASSEAGLDEEKAIGVPVFTSYSASFTNLLSDIVDIVGGKDFENASKLFDACLAPENKQLQIP